MSRSWVPAVAAVLVWCTLVASPSRLQAQQPAWTLLRDLEYARREGRPLTLDLYLPNHPGSGPWPLVVWFHGQPGRKSPTPARRLVRSGFAVASVEYRSPRAARFPAQIHDAKAAVRWLREHAATHRLDPDHIAAWGESAGGYLAVMLATSAGDSLLDAAPATAPSSRVQAAVNYFGPGRRGAASPLSYISADDAPVLTVHGSADRTVSPARSERLHSALRAAGVESTLEIVPGGRHDFTKVHSARIDSLVRSFLDRHLRRNGPPAPP